MIGDWSRAGGLVLAACAATAVGACSLQSNDPHVEVDAQNVSTDRCASAQGVTSAVVKVMTVNLRHDADQWRRRFSLIADEIARLDPDIIGLQEIEIADDQADRLNDLLEERGHARYHVHAKRKSGISGYFSGEGVGIMSRWPIAEKHHVDLGEMRVGVVARVAYPSGGFIDVANTHLQHGGGPDGDATRDDQARRMVQLVDRNDDCHPTVLTGDMNATENAPALQRFRAAGFVDSYREVHGATTPETGNTSTVVLGEGAFEQNPGARIDFVLGRPAGGRTVTAVESVVCFMNHAAEGFYPSDHFGVMTTYAMKLGGADGEASGGGRRGFE